MNRELAINYLRSSGFSDEQIKAIEGAFTCDDAISRQAVLDKIRAEMDGLLNDEDSNMYAHGVMDCLEIIDKFMAEGSEKE